ncbi:hypothetical protein ACFSSF_08065 [Dietzia aerolata]|uniref:hypothetical protein n=1 Tax=Dietzia aerolata TaxID=595984 RepID=UPI00364526CB
MTDSHSHAAADPLSLRFPGGRLRPEDWTALAQVAGENGSELRLSLSGTVQILGVQDVASHREQVFAAGLAPGTAHHRVRSILSSPWPAGSQAVTISAICRIGSKTSCSDARTSRR